MDGDERAHLHDDLPETGLRSEVGLQAREAQLDGRNGHTFRALDQKDTRGGWAFRVGPEVKKAKE
jgi:hypothetical protein